MESTESTVELTDAIKREITRQAKAPNAVIALGRNNDDPDSVQLIGKLDLRALAKAMIR